MNIRWDYFVNHFDASRYLASSEARDNRHIQFVREFASVVSVLQVGKSSSLHELETDEFDSQDKTNNVIDLYKDISRAVEDLATCPYTSDGFSELLSKIQSAVCVFT